METLTALNLGSFRDLDTNLIRLALTDAPNRVPISTYTVLSERYGLQPEFADNRALTLYGDSVINMILLDEFKRRFRLNVRPEQINMLRSGISQSANSYLSLSSSSDVCRRLNELSSTTFGAPVLDPWGVPIPQQAAQFNCNVSLSAVVGALYFQYGAERLKDMADWLRRVVPIEQLVTEFEYNAGRVATVSSAAPGAFGQYAPVAAPVADAAVVAPTLALANVVTTGKNATFEEFITAFNKNPDGQRINFMNTPGTDTVNIVLTNTNGSESSIGQFQVPGLASGQTVRIDPALAARTLKEVGVWNV